VQRRIVSLVGVVVLFLILSFSLLTATPLGHNIGLNFNSSKSGNTMEMVSNRNGNSTLNSVVAQATATAVYTNQQNDGYDPYANGGMTVAAGNSSRPWPYGQCTYWANYYYHQLSGWYVQWSGNADEWVAGANAAGWNVSTQPHVPSIAVLMPGVQGASYAYGHVAVVTSIVDSTTVLTSNMNWWAYGGGWGIVSNVEFNYGPGYGVYFVWHS
jgi:surface antigen